MYMMKTIFRIYCEELVSEVRNIIESIRPDVLKNVFESWKGRLLDCWNSGDKYVE
jgi:hypothetical protein